MNLRTTKLKEKIAGKTPVLDSERAVFYTKSWKCTEGEPIVMRRALAFKEVMENQTVFIDDGELIVGNQAGQYNAAPIFPEYGIEWIVGDIEKMDQRMLDKFEISEKDAKALLEIEPYWRGRTHFDKCKEELSLILPEEYGKSWNPEHGDFNGVVTNSGRMTTGDGHVIANFERIINTGLQAEIQRAENNIKEWGVNKQEPEAARSIIFLKSAIISMKAAIRFSERYAEEAVRQAEKEMTSVERKKELLEIARICRKVPKFGAESFYEALQSYWMIHLILQIESNGHSMSFGRFDQYLMPYYEKDLEKGMIDHDIALELLECMFVKCNQIKKIRAMSHTRKMHGYPMFQTLTLGGQTKAGSDASNAVSYLTLEATANIKLQEPTTIARVFPKTSPLFLTKCCETIVSHGGGQPGMFNDEVAVPMLMRLGVTLEDARDWAVDGCCEPIVPGKHNTINAGCCHINLLKVLEIALDGGENKDRGTCVFPGEKTLAEMETFEEVVEAYKKQLKEYVALIPMFDEVTSRAHEELTPCPFLSSVLDYRLDIAKDVEAGGGPNYNNTLSICHGAINVGNALYALKTEVYEKKICTPKEIYVAMQNDWEGYELIRRKMLDAPKYGNDIDEVDYMVRDSLNWYYDELCQYTPAHGGTYCPSPQTLSANAYTGEKIGATSDGRKAGATTADNVSPDTGTDLAGATAAMMSVAKLDHIRATNGTIFNMKLHPTAVSGAERIEKFTALIRAYFEFQGFQVQFNVVSAETLRDAQQKPEEYKGLVVKVAGYSALFTNLDPHLQDQIIARTEHHIA